MFKCSTARVIPCCATAMAVFCSFATTSLALDGRIDFRGHRQGGRTGELTYKTENLWENYSLDQRFQFTNSTLFQLRYSVQRENLWSRAGDIASETKKETQVPFVGFTYRGRRVRAGLTGNGIRKDTFTPGVDTRRDENLTKTAWARTDIGKVELNARYLSTRTERTQGDDFTETENRVLRFIARYAATDDDRLGYLVTHTKDKGTTFGTKTEYLNNVLEYKGNHRFAQNRGRASITTSVSRFDQTNTYLIAGTREYLSPLWGDRACNNILAGSRNRYLEIKRLLGLDYQSRR